MLKPDQWIWLEPKARVAQPGQIVGSAKGEGQEKQFQRGRESASANWVAPYLPIRLFLTAESGNLRLPGKRICCVLDGKDWQGAGSLWDEFCCRFNTA